jgi:hypothetical protein
MKRYLSTLACSGLLSIGALCGGAFAATLPSPIPDILPTVNAVGEAFRALPAQPMDSGIHGVLLHKQSDDPGGMRLVRGGGGGGGHGGGMGGNSAGGSAVGGGGVWGAASLDSANIRVLTATPITAPAIQDIVGDIRRVR